MSSQIWLITGCSSGLGAALAHEVLRRGDQVIATAPDVLGLQELEKAGAATLELDVTSSPDMIKSTVGKALHIYGRIDVLLNNAGMALLGAVEEVLPEEEQHVFQVNVFGALNVARAVLPSMRAQKSGNIFFISSLSAWVGGPSSACYSASKAALSLYVESLRSEVKPFGIAVGSLEPGALRTHFLGHSQVTAHLMPEYDGTVARESLKKTRDFDFKQRGDVNKAAKVILDIITATDTAKGKEAPPRLVIGADAYEFAKNWCNTWLQTLEDWREVIVQTDIEE